jgi:hypothetical protein
MRFVANVLSGFDDTMGATFFDLTELQARVRAALLGTYGQRCAHLLLVVDAELNTRSLSYCKEYSHW